VHVGRLPKAIGGIQTRAIGLPLYRVIEMPFGKERKTKDGI
jgi:hypothetical protein